MEETQAQSTLTIEKEEGALEGWKKALGDIRLTQITCKTVNDYTLERKKAASRTARPTGN